MGDYQIRCINKPGHDSPHERITHIGNGAWRLTLDTAIALIDSGYHTFYTLDSRGLLSSAFLDSPLASSGLLGSMAAARAEIRVVRNGLVGHMRPYLRTQRDGIYTDNLLSLPECSAMCQVVMTPW